MGKSQSILKNWREGKRGADMPQPVPEHAGRSTIVFRVVYRDPAPAAD